MLYGSLFCDILSGQKVLFYLLNKYLFSLTNVVRLLYFINNKVEEPR
ncbi:hypothetical protein HMPREF9969_1411 [Prevotella sp. oral taxon 306 str. F0472]|nr:hypothetical protein HMPREF9969_1411 [Prevotella sp. oral taxon 306 str. F0472]